MADETKLRKRRERKRDEKAKLRKRKIKLELEEREVGGKIRKARKLAKTRKTDETREKAADHADFLIGERKRVRAEIEEVKADLGEVNARLRRISKKLKRAIQKRLASQRYWASENFRFDEFDCNDGTPVPKSAYPAIRHLCETVLEPCRARFGAVHVNSGFRHTAYNRAIGGEANSVHIYDLHPNAVAADYTCANGSPSQVFYFTADKADGRGRYATFHHADNRNRIGWPDAVWSG